MTNQLSVSLDLHAEPRFLVLDFFNSVLYRQFSSFDLLRHDSSNMNISVTPLSKEKMSPGYNFSDGLTKKLKRVALSSPTSKTPLDSM